MINIFLILLWINVISFIVFVLRKYFDNLVFIDELVTVIAIGGSFGAFLAMKIKKNGGSSDESFKIAIPISIIIQVVVISYLFLYDLGFLK